MSAFERDICRLVTDWKMSSMELLEYIENSKDQGYIDRKKAQRDRLNLCISQVEGSIKFHEVDK